MDSAVYLLSKITGDNALKRLLTNNAKRKGDAKKMIPLTPKGSSIATALPASGTKLSAKELEEVKLIFSEIRQSFDYSNFP